jgi:hypothetical protein
LKKSNATFCMVVLMTSVLLGLGARTSAQKPPEDFSGNWTMYVTSTKDGQINVRHVRIVQNGTQVSGHFKGEYQSGPITGEVTGNRIHFITDTKNPINFRGEIFGNKITGEYVFHGKKAPWTAER